MPPKRKAPPQASVKEQRQSRHWCFTTYKEGAVLDPEAYIATLHAPATYCVLQREICPRTSRPHLQGYIVLVAKKTRAGVQAVLGDAVCHVEIQRAKENNKAADYCLKPESRDPAPGSGPFEVGLRPEGGPGCRTDINDMKRLIDAGADDKALADADFGTWCRYYKPFGEYRNLSAPPRQHQTYGVVYWGPSGAGKSRAAAWYDTPERTFWVARPAGSTVWWEGYNGQRTVIFDDFYGWLKRDLMQRLIDRTPLRVERKLGSFNFAATTVIITSNVDPPRFWKRLGLGAMSRRLAAPIGAVVFVGDDEYPTAESYELYLAGLDAAAQPPINQRY